MTEQKIVSLASVAGGAIEEKFDYALRDVLANIADLNTDPKKKRKITLTMTVSGNEQRTLGEVSFQIKTSLAPAKPIETSLLIDTDGKRVTGAELKSGQAGQTFIDDDGDVADDRGHKIERNERKDKGNVVGFK